MENFTTAEMPKYQSHKIVHAIKIDKIELDSVKAEEERRETDGHANLIGDGFDVNVDHSYVKKHDPQIGGYYIVYEDGYKSFSPAEAFEKGYTKI